MDDARVERGRAIAASKRLRQAPDGTWVVLSQTQPRLKYVVNLTAGTCSCPDFQEWELDCKHIYAARFFQTPAQVELDERKLGPVRVQYPQDWAAYNAAQINEKDFFGLLLKGLCDPIEQPKQTNGRPRLQLGDVIHASVMKVYTTMSGRRASTDIRQCESQGHIDHAPHHNSISNYLCQPELTPILKALIEQAAAPLKAIESQFAVDATGFSTCVYDRWFDHKYGKESGRKQRWIKCHAMVGTITNVVTSVEVTEGHVADTTQLPELLRNTTKTFDVKELSADKAYLSITNLSTMGKLGVEPFIPFKLNSTGEGSVGVWKKMWHMFWFKRDEFLQHYHRRSNVESTFSAIKRKFGGSVRSKNFTSQVNEVLCKILAHNIVVVVHEMHGLGITPDFWPKPAELVQ
jgi:transposase